MSIIVFYTPVDWVNSDHVAAGLFGMDGIRKEWDDMTLEQFFVSF